MTYHDEMDADAATPLGMEFHGEPVTYTPKGGEAVEIYAIVHRDPTMVRGDDGRRRMTDGIEMELDKSDVPDVVENGDVVTFPKRPGSVATLTRPVAKVLRSVGGTWGVRLG